MKVPTHPYQCPLGRLQPSVTDLDAMKQRGWRDQNILVVNAHDTRLDYLERELVRRIGERLYGQGDRHAKA
ncbi:hypothetical protein [Rhodoferax sp.]|uniref:hypothetical protein n=1 Tax=Rhodoferax sp. TaxID=50421 RepID=UPI0019E022EB|nr:hypothetical protein [Rhodoferax sp.]MBE0474811.1 hypothetical protein [Rhodoferax sp.]